MNDVIYSEFKHCFPRTCDIAIKSRLRYIIVELNETKRAYIIGLECKYISHTYIRIYICMIRYGDIYILMQINTIVLFSVKHLIYYYTYILLKIFNIIFLILS